MIVSPIVLVSNEIIKSLSNHWIIIALSRNPQGICVVHATLVLFLILIKISVKINYNYKDRYLDSLYNPYWLYNF